MDNLKTNLERVRAAVGGPMPMKTMRAYLAASDDAFRFLRTHGEALAGMVRDAERLDWVVSKMREADKYNAWYPNYTIGGDYRAAIDQAMQESRDGN